MNNKEISFSVGTVIQIPNNFQIDYGKTQSNSDEPSPFIRAKIEGEYDRFFDFFPELIFTKSIHPYVNGEQQETVNASGSASDLFRKAHTIEDGLNLLRGKRVCVTKKTTYSVLNSENKKLVNSDMYQLDLISEDIIPIVRENEVLLFQNLSKGCNLLLPKTGTITKHTYSVALEIAYLDYELRGEHCEDWISLSCRWCELPDTNYKGFKVKEQNFVVLLSKQNQSFLLYDYLEDKHSFTCIVPLPGYAVDFSAAYREIDDSNRYAQVVILNDKGEYGVFDVWGDSIIPFSEDKISLITPGFQNPASEHIFSVIESVNGKALYYKSKCLIENFKIVHPYDYKNKVYLSALFDYGWQIYDCSLWMENKALLPQEMLSKKLPTKYEPIPYLLHENIIGVCDQQGKTDKYGFVDLSGELIIPCVYNEIIHGFENGIACVIYDNDYSYINIDTQNKIHRWGNLERDREEASERYWANTSVGDWSFADAELEDFRDNYDY